ncbi:MAG: hypothetical protein S0880_36955 [Actinomycetota bacterium]|nr:hypothetical protein [Actinomycetota bacterium]
MGRVGGCERGLLLGIEVDGAVEVREMALARLARGDELLGVDLCPDGGSYSSSWEGSSTAIAPSPDGWAVAPDCASTPCSAVHAWNSVIACPGSLGAPARRPRLAARVGVPEAGGATVRGHVDASPAEATRT